jgi:phosphoribosyl-ATP pyrophosphohydrolase/phosphoribosyl-AMP cyclohydrolase
LECKSDAIVLMQPTIPQMSSPAGVQTTDAQQAIDAQQTTDAQISYDERGLVPCVIQDWYSGEVLTMAYMNEQALRRTRATGELHLWSRSRGELWRKGETSGNTQTVRALRLDCDGDTLLALVEPAGPACHTGERTCFHRGELEPPAPYETLPALERTLSKRAQERPAGSYTVELLDDPGRIGEKVMEEAEEVARAAREESEERVDEEAADVLYHLLVLLHSRGRALADAERVLDERRS